MGLETSAYLMSPSIPAHRLETENPVIPYGFNLVPAGRTFPGGLGNCNLLYLLQPSNATLDHPPLLVFRTPKHDRLCVCDDVHDELYYTGFLQSGGSYRWRDTAQQLKHIHSLAMAQVSVLYPLWGDGEGMLYQYIEGQTLKKYLENGGIKAIGKVLDNMFQAHREGLCFGDSWTPNTLVTNGGRVFEFDFDLEILGPNTREFDLAKLLYHTLHFSRNRERMLKYLDQYFESVTKLPPYELDKVILFINNYAQHHRSEEEETGKKYEDQTTATQPQIESLTSTIKTTTSAVPQSSS